MVSSIVVYGGSGALGRAIVAFFVKKQWAVTCVDFSANHEATTNILLEKTDSLEEQGKRVVGAISGQVDAIVCVAGGWAGGNAASADLFANSELMWKQSVHSSLVAAHLASKSLKAGGLLTLTGAFPAQKVTPLMKGYRMAKAAVHQLVASLAGPDSGIPADAKVNAILPVTLDTPMNRSGMPNADFSSWTPCSEVAETLYGWATNAIPVTSGKLVEIVTKDGKTTYTENSMDEGDRKSLPEYSTYLETHYRITPVSSSLDTLAKSRMLAGHMYDCNDRRLVLERQRGNDITILYNSWDATLPSTHEEEQHARKALVYLLTAGQVGKDCWIEPPLQVDYGNNLELGTSVRLGPNCVVLDCAKVSIGERTLVEAGVMLFTATHPTNPLLRHPHWLWDFAMPVRIGRDCRIGGGAVLCPGVDIGDGVTVMERSVVTKSVPPYVVVEGAPARITRVLSRDDCEEEAKASMMEKDWTQTPVETLTLP
ncbi:hypothetical protein BGZ70_010379 [Mortierella alpina]|uniref:Dihydropteridine reductase n=1 Tax=Mortierella alpina TaxID=64518 RepID=A0A9P6IZT3_MORAP|nr:hypothetical protein BGZ70_010379 [Mortierella alpina]